MLWDLIIRAFKENLTMINLLEKKFRILLFIVRNKQNIKFK